MLHGKKKISILQWYNSLTTKRNVHSFAQFTDGSHFYDIVTSLNLIYPEKQKDAKTEAGLADSMNPMDVNIEQINTVTEEAIADKSVSQNTITDSLEMEKEGDIDSQKKYDAVKKFIDDFFQLDSTSLVNYSECMKGIELELAKVAVLLLSALVQNLLSEKNQLIYTTTLLDQQVQEDIKECLSLVLKDRSQDDGQFKKSEFHKILNRSAVCEGTPRRRNQSRSSGSTDHSEASERGKKTSKKRKERASSIVYEDLQDSPMKSLLESPNMQYKAVIHRKESELLKLRNALHTEENKVFDLTAEKNTLSEELEKKKKEVESLKKEFRKYREEVEEKECIKLKEIKEQEEEIKRLKELIQSQREENNQLNQVNETLNKKVEEIEKKLAEKTVPVCNDKQHMVNSAELVIKDDKIVHLEDEVKKLEKKLQMLEEIPNERNACSSSPDDPEVMSNITNGNDVIKALFSKKENEKTLLMKELLEEQNRANLLEVLLQSAKKEKQELENEINKKMIELTAKKSDLSSYEEQLDFFEKNCACLKNLKTNCSSGKEQEGFDDSQVSSTNSEHFLSEAKSGSTLAEELGPLWNNVGYDSVFKKRKTSVEFHSFMFLAETDFGILKKMIQELFTLIQGKHFVLDSQDLNKLLNELSDVECIKQILLALSNIIDILKLSKPNTPTTNRRSRSDIDPQIKALILEKTELKKENESLSQELTDVKKHSKFQLEMKEVELQVSKKHCEKLQAAETELNATIDQVRKEAKENDDKYKCAKKYIEKQKVDYKKLMKMYMMLAKSPELDKSLRNPCNECEKLKQKIRELQSECNDCAEENQELKATVRNLDDRMQNFEHRVRRLEHEKEELEFKLRREVSFLSGTLSDREAVMLRYYNKAMIEFDMKAKALEKTKKLQEGSSIHTMSANAYVMNGDKKNSIGESSMSIGNRSIRSGFFQVADEEDFLNHSSLAEIHSGGFTEDSNADDRLKELRRRNTLCLPHLQSSYPLEIVNMTPTERKYYEAQQEPWQPVNKTFVSEEEREFYRKQEAQFLRIDSDDNDSRDTFTLNKRKAVEDNSTNASKKIHRPSSVSTQKIIRMKPTTPVQRRASLLKKGSFRTPSSIRRFISMPRKNIKK